MNKPIPVANPVSPLLSGTPPGCGLLWRILALTVVSGVLLSAVRGEEEVMVEFSFQTYFLQDTSAEEGGLLLPELYFRRGDDFLLLSLAPHAIGLRHVFRGPLPFTLYRRGMAEDGSVFHQPAAVLTTDFTSTRPGHQVIVIGIRNDELRLRSIATGPPGENEITVLNASSRTLAARAGGSEVVTIAAGGWGVVPYYRNENHVFRLEIASNEENRWQRIYNAAISQVNQRPLFLIVYPDTHAARHWQVRFLTIDS